MLTDETIDRFLAEKCGYWPDHARDWGCADCDRPANYTRSLDALFDKDGPVEKCREAGYPNVYVGYSLLSPMAYASVNDGAPTPIATVEAKAPARALAEACFYALGGTE